MHVSAPPRGGPTTRSCCSRGSPASPRESGSRRRCSRCGVARLRRSPWQRRAWNVRPMAASRSASARAARRSWRACTDSRGSNRSSRMRDTLVAVRALLEGARLPLDREHVRPLRLGLRPERRIPILLAALAPSSVRLAGELADDWLPVPLGTLETRRRPGAAGRGRGSRRALDSDRRCRERPARDRPGRGDRQADRRRLAARVSHPHGSALSANAAGPLRLSRARSMPSSKPTAAADRPRLPAAAERLARDVTVMGTYDEAPDAIRRWLDGVPTPSTWCCHSDLPRTS